MSFLHPLSCILEDLTGKLILMRSLGGSRGGEEVAVWVAEALLYIYILTGSL